MLAPLLLSASLALAMASDSVQLLGPADQKAPLPRGVLKLAVTLYDRAEGGRALWESPAFTAAAMDWRWIFSGASGPAGPAPLKDLPAAVFAEFRTGSSPLVPRQPFHLSEALSSPTKLVFEPGPAPSRAPVDRVRVAQPPPRLTGPEDDGIDVGGGEGRVLIDREEKAAAPARPRAAPKGGGEAPNLDDLRLSNNLYFQALREFRNGNTAMAVSKLDVALSLNPANSDARLALERIRQETEPADGPRAAAAPSPEDAGQAQELYFQALRDYAKGRVRRARDELLQAAQLDPTDRGIAAALLHLRRELALVRSDGIH